MSPELVSILVLIAMFAAATALPVNMGVLAFVAAFVVGSVYTDVEPKSSPCCSRAIFSFSSSESLIYLPSRRATAPSPGWWVPPLGRWGVAS